MAAYYALNIEKVEFTLNPKEHRRILNE